MSHAADTALAPQSHLAGAGLVLTAGALWSLGGILVRLVEVATPWQILLYRSLAVVALVTAVLLWRHGRRIWQVYGAGGWIAVAAGGSVAVAFIGFIFALAHTTVANSVFMLSAAPLMTAGLGILFLGERVRPISWAMMSLAVIGVAVMFWGGFANGTLFGNGMAFLAAIGFTGFSIALRKGQRIEMMPAIGIGGAIAASVAAAMLAFGDGFAVSFRDFGLAAGYGFGLIGLGMMIYVAGSKHLPAAELTLLSLSEVVLGALWPWWLLGETMSRHTFAGGVILMAALAGLALSGIRRRPAPPAA